MPGFRTTKIDIRSVVGCGVPLVTGSIFGGFEIRMAPSTRRFLFLDSGAGDEVRGRLRP